uniref:Uncharacterized protein n=1 Tax=Cucumis sativus TaxID=3659 RepID=A0A0A0L2Z9_CUCSA
MSSRWICWVRKWRNWARDWEKGRLLITASWARRTLAAATSFMASVSFWVFLMESSRDRSSRVVPPHRIEMGCGDLGMRRRRENGVWWNLGSREWIMVERDFSRVFLFSFFQSLRM